MADEFLEKKVFYIGTWSDNSFTDTIIREVATHVEANKGSKVRLSLSRDGIRVVKSNFVQGKYLHSFIPLLNIYYIVVNQYNPNCVLVIAKSKKKKYQIIGYRCANGLDAGLFVQTFKAIHRALKPGEGYNFDLKTHDGINWTLRSKSEAAKANTRQLSQLVDIHGETAVIQQNGDIEHKPQSEEPNNNIPQQKPRIVDSGTTAVKVQTKGGYSPTNITYRTHGKQQAETGVQVVTRDEDFRDSISETSENVVIFNELDHLSHEIKEIKFMLEKSTGIGAEEYHQKLPVTHTGEHNRNMTSEPMDAEILPDTYELVAANEVYSENERDNFNEDSEVKVSVPDYRSFGVQTAPKSKRQITPRVATTTTNVQQPTVNYNKWQNNYMTVPSKTESVRLRNSVFRPRVYSSSRPRSATLSNKWVPVEIDISNQPNKVTFDPNTMPEPNAVRRRTTMSFSTTVRRPIEKVYQRPSMFRGTIGHRPHSAWERPNSIRQEHHAATYVLTPEDDVKVAASNGNFEQQVVVPNETGHTGVRSS